MNDSLLSLEVENLRELLRLKALNDRLLDANHNLLVRLVNLSGKSGISLDAETLALVSEVRSVLRQIGHPSDESLREKTRREGDSTSRGQSFIAEIPISIGNVYRAG